MGLLRLLGISEKREQSATDNDPLGLLFAVTARTLRGMSEAKIKMITGYAGLLGKVAYADMDISEKELENMHRVLRDVLGLAEAELASITRICIDHRVQLFSVEDHLYARLINEVATREQKLQLIEALFALAAADETVSQHEDASIWTAAKSLGLSHREFIEIRKKYQAYLAVLRDRPRSG